MATKDQERSIAVAQDYLQQTNGSNSSKKIRLQRNPNASYELQRRILGVTKELNPDPPSVKPPDDAPPITGLPDALGKHYGNTKAIEKAAKDSLPRLDPKVGLNLPSSFRNGTLSSRVIGPHAQTEFTDSEKTATSKGKIGDGGDKSKTGVRVEGDWEGEKKTRTRKFEAKALKVQDLTADDGETKLRRVRGVGVEMEGELTEQDSNLKRKLTVSTTRGGRYRSNEQGVQVSGDAQVEVDDETKGNTKSGSVTKKTYAGDAYTVTPYLGNQGQETEEKKPGFLSRVAGVIFGRNQEVKTGRHIMREDEVSWIDRNEEGSISRKINTGRGGRVKTNVRGFGEHEIRGPASVSIDATYKETEKEVRVVSRMALDERVDIRQYEMQLKGETYSGGRVKGILPSDTKGDIRISTAYDGGTLTKIEEHLNFKNHGSDEPIDYRGAHAGKGKGIEIVRKNGHTEIFKPEVSWGRALFDRATGGIFCGTTINSSWDPERREWVTEEYKI